MNNMRNSADQLGALIDSVEKLRRERFPHLDSDMIRQILELHRNPEVLVSDIKRQVELVVEGYLGKDN
jgi:hypothetical protein